MNALEVMQLGKELAKDVHFTVLDLPLVRQRQLAKQSGFGDDLLAWQTAQAQRIEKSKEWSEQNPVHIFDTPQDAESAGFVVPKWQKSSETINAIHHGALD